MHPSGFPSDNLKQFPIEGIQAKEVEVNNKKRLQLTLSGDSKINVAIAGKIKPEYPESAWNRFKSKLGLSHWVVLQVNAGKSTAEYARVNAESLRKNLGCTSKEDRKAFMEAIKNNNFDLTNFVRSQIPPKIKVSSEELKSVERIKELALDVNRDKAEGILNRVTSGALIYKNNEGDYRLYTKNNGFWTNNLLLSKANELKNQSPDILNLNFLSYADQLLPTKSQGTSSKQEALEKIRKQMIPPKMDVKRDELKDKKTLKEWAMTEEKAKSLLDDKSPDSTGVIYSKGEEDMYWIKYRDSNRQLHDVLIDENHLPEFLPEAFTLYRKVPQTEMRST